MNGASASSGWTRRFRVGSRVLILFSGLALAACQTDGSGSPTAYGGSNRTLAFDSIDGPPKSTFDKLVAELSSEAQSQQMPVVSRTAASTYRVRGYLSAHTDKSKTAITYVWDVFDADRQRIARVTGEEVVKRGKGDAWAACDQETLNRIAGKSLASLAETVGLPTASGQPRGGTPAGTAVDAAGPSEAPAAVPSAPAPDGGETPMAQAGSVSALAYAAP